MTNDKRTYTERMNAMFGIVVAAGVISGIAILGYQILIWLKFARWPEIPFFTFLELWGLNTIANIEWVGVRKMVIWVLDLPLSLMLPVCGVLLAAMLSAILRGSTESE